MVPETMTAEPPTASVWEGRTKAFESCAAVLRPKAGRSEGWIVVEPEALMATTPALEGRAEKDVPERLMPSPPWEIVAPGRTKAGEAVVMGWTKPVGGLVIGAGEGIALGPPVAAGTMPPLVEVRTEKVVAGLTGAPLPSLEGPDSGAPFEAGGDVSSGESSLGACGVPEGLAGFCVAGGAGSSSSSGCGVPDGVCGIPVTGGAGSSSGSSGVSLGVDPGSSGLLGGSFSAGGSSDSSGGGTGAVVVGRLVVVREGVAVTLSAGRALVVGVVVGPSEARVVVLGDESVIAGSSISFAGVRATGGGPVRNRLHCSNTPSSGYQDASSGIMR